VSRAIHRSLIVQPDEAVAALLRLDHAARLERYYGERAAFYNPGRDAPLGVIFGSVKEHDGPNDRSSNLSRPGVYRLALGLTPLTFRRLFGEVPARPAKGEVLSLDGFDLEGLNELTPHPIYAWMSWVQVLSPSIDRFESLRPLLDEALVVAKERWQRRRSA
jgi:Family of unknown function (DUF6194)